MSVSSVYNFVFRCLPNVYISRNDRRKELTLRSQSLLIIPFPLEAGQVVCLKPAMEISSFNYFG